jgi:hypothetical protein
MPKRKYITEFGLVTTGATKVLLQQDQLVNLANSRFADSPLHIYMILRRPRIMLDPNSVTFTLSTVSGLINVQRGAEIETHKFEVPNYMGTANLRIECSFPHTEYKVFNMDTNEITGGRTALLVSTFRKFDDLMPLEVIYVGQSYGADGTRMAPERLMNHSTLQGIYEEAIRLSPDQDIWLLLWSFNAEAIIVFDPTQETLTTSEEDDIHLEKVLTTGITEQQQINFTEAALIRYFQPEYNILFKDSFPNPAHKTYSECYDLDINALFVEIETHDIFCKLWSAKVPAAWVHKPGYLLNSRKERKVLLDFLEGESFTNYDEMA